MKITPYFHYLPSGEILCAGSCPEHEVEIQCPLPGAKIATGDAKWGRDYYDLSAKTVRPLPPRPSEHHEFDYVAKQWRLNIERAWASVRADRDRRLLASDWTQLPDVPLATKERWVTFRQALRDITSQPDPLNISWPSPPA